MDLKWRRDKNHTDCWDLYENESKLGFVLRTTDTDQMVWVCWYGKINDLEMPGVTAEEAKSIVKAMVLLNQ